MSKNHDPRLTLEQMLEFAEMAKKLFGEMPYDEYRSNQIAQLAATRLLELIGEASSRLSAEFRGSHPVIDWRVMIGMRNRLIHGYDDLSPKIIYDTIALDMQPLIESLKLILEEKL